MATKPQPWPRKANRSRHQAVNAAMEILVIMRPLLGKDSHYRNDPLIMGIVAQASYQARDIIDLLTSIPADDEK